MVSVTELDVLLPELETVIDAVPVLAISTAGTVAETWVGDVYAVFRAPPFQLMVDPTANPVPVTVRVNAGLPAVTVLGLILVTVGALPDEIVKTAALEFSVNSPLS